MALRLCSLRLLRTRPGSLCRLLSLSAPASQGGNQTASALYTPEHSAIRDSLRKIIDTEINPYVDQWEKEEQFPAHHVFKILGKAGMLGVNKPPEYGGMGLDFSYSIAIAEELGNINCGGIPMAIGVQSDMATPALTRFGSDELKRQFLAPTIAGDVVACLGVSESGAGSDVASIKTKAERKGDDYIINGSKMWITNGCQADWMCLLTNTSAGPSHKNKSLICLPMKTPGVHVTKKIDKMGMKSSDTAQIFFEDVRVPSKYLIGEEGMGFIYQMLQFQEERMWGVANGRKVGNQWRPVQTYPKSDSWRVLILYNNLHTMYLWFLLGAKSFFAFIFINISPFLDTSGCFCSFRGCSLNL
ncbi:probable acyl-CoA dehydrogenase 6 isoform X2 [Engystomops pustulosus]